MIELFTATSDHAYCPDPTNEEDGFSVGACPKDGKRLLARAPSLGGPELAMQRSMSGSPGQVALSIDVTISFQASDFADVTALGLVEVIPPGFRFDGVVGGDAPGIAPTAGSEGVLEFAWLPVPRQHGAFTYRVEVPLGGTSSAGSYDFIGEGLYRALGGEGELRTPVEAGAVSDADGDGIADAVEGSGDADNDGIPNYLDIDSDGDDIGDALEGTDDPDADGTPNYLDTDSDADSIPDAVEGAEDMDDDGLPAYLDEDSDGDGVPNQVEEAAGSDPYDGLEAAGVPLGAPASVKADEDRQASPGTRTEGMVWHEKVASSFRHDDGHRPWCGVAGLGASRTDADAYRRLEWQLYARNHNRHYH